MACSGRVRDRFGWLVLAIGVFAGLSTQLAIESGKALRHSVRKSASLSRHVHIAESIRPLILVLFLLALGIMLVDRRARGVWPFVGAEGHRAPSSWTRVALVAVTVLVALGTTVRLFQIGDSGAKATWERVHLQASNDRNRAGRH